MLTSLPAGFGAAIGRTVTLDLGALDPSARKTPFSDQVTLGVARELRTDLALTVDYIYLRGHDLFRTVDLNGPSAFDTTTGATRTIAQADATRPYGSPSRVPGPYGIKEGGFKQIRAVVSEGNGWYHGLKLNLTKRFSQQPFLSGVVHAVACRERAGRFRIGGAGQRSVRLPPRAGVQRRPAYLRGERHLHPAVHDFALGHRGGEVRAARSIRWPAPISTATGSRPIAPAHFARNSFRLPTSKTVDVSLAKTFAVGGPHQLELRMDVFNLFDAFNVTAVNNTYGRVVGSPVATFMQPTRVSNPRQLQFAARYRF